MDRALTILEALVKEEPLEIPRQRVDAVRVNVEIGIIRLGKGDFLAALDAFLQAESWIDAAYVAERVMTVEELAAFVDAHQNDAAMKAPPAMALSWYLRMPRGDMVAYLLGRRYARAGDWERARNHLPAEWHDELDALTGHLVRSRHASLSAEERAMERFQAARVVRRHGMELMGTELGPDWRLFGGAYEPELGVDARIDLLASPDEKTRVLRHRLPVDKRYHYRYVAADMGWEAAALLPDNHDLTARILYESGGWLKERDPKAADRFYKALVNRCRQLPIGKEADRCRWFPPGYYEDVKDSE